MNQRLQVPVFINESWRDVIWPWEKKNKLPFVSVIFHKTRHTVDLNMGQLNGSHHRILTPAGVRQIIGVAREYSRSVTSCRVFLCGAEILNVSVKDSGLVAETIAQIVSVEYDVVSHKELCRASQVRRELKEGTGIHGHILGTKEITLKTKKYRDSVWDNPEAQRREKHDPANWWK